MTAEKLHSTFSTEQTAEEKNVALAMAGDMVAFGKLYEHYLDAVYNYVFYRVSSREEAEDLCELVFLRAWQGLDKYPPREAPFLFWLYSIARNAVVDHYRAAKDKVGLEAAAEIASPIEGPEEIVAREQSVSALRQAMKLLTEDYQEVLTWRFIVGLSHAETAAIMLRSEDAVRALQYRAIVALRNMFILKEGNYV